MCSRLQRRYKHAQYCTARLSCDATIQVSYGVLVPPETSIQLLFNSSKDVQCAISTEPRFLYHSCSSWTIVHCSPLSLTAVSLLSKGLIKNCKKAPRKSMTKSCRTIYIDCSTSVATDPQSMPLQFF